MSGIKISPKYGLNPTIPVCFWCGKPKNEIALMGKMSHKEERRTAWGGTSTRVIESDVEAPKHMILDYGFCDECEKNMSLGVAVIELSDVPQSPNQPPIREGLYPTSRFVVVTTECADRVFSQYAPWEKGKKVHVDSEVFKHFITD